MRNKSFSIVVILLLALFASPIESQTTGHMTVEDDPNGFRYACGPLSLFAALRSTGHTVAFEEIVQKCNHITGNGVKIEVLCKAADLLCPEHSKCGRVSPKQLIDTLSDGGAAVAFVRKESPIVNHAIAIVGSRQVEGTTWLMTIDYPNINREKSISELVSVWDGDVLLIENHSKSKPLSSIELFLGLLLPAFVVFYAISFILQSVRLKPKSITNSSTSEV